MGGRARGCDQVWRDALLALRDRATARIDDRPGDVSREDRIELPAIVGIDRERAGPRGRQRRSRLRGGFEARVETGPLYAIDRDDRDDREDEHADREADSVRPRQARAKCHAGGLNRYPAPRTVASNGGAPLSANFARMRRT